MLACTAQFKLLPVAFIALIPLVRPHDGWKPMLAGCSLCMGLLALNQVLWPQLTADYILSFGDAGTRMDDRGIVNPSSLALFRDFLDLTANMPGLAQDRRSGAIAYSTEERVTL